MRSATPIPRDARRLAYVVSRFPKLSETFILREMDALEQLGWRIDVFPFVHHREDVRHPEVDRWTARLDPVDSWPRIALANLAWLAESPSRLVGLYGLVVRSLWRRPGELVRGLVAVAYAARWAQRVRNRGISHVHAHFALHPAVAALAIARLAGVTFSFTGHAHDIYRDQTMLARKVRDAAFVIVISRLLRDRYITPIVRPRDITKVQVVRCGVDTSTYMFSPCGFDRDGEMPPTLLTVARLVEFKGLRFLIEACRQLAARGLDVRCQIIGDGPLREALGEQIRACGLSDRVTLRGARSQAEVREALSTASLFILPSVVAAHGDMEGIPVSLMEAMAMGVPVIATSTGAVPELVHDAETGLIVAPGDAPALASAIDRLLHDRALARRLAAAARARVEAEYDLRSSALRLHGLLAGVTDGGDRVRCAMGAGGARSVEAVG